MRQYVYYILFLIFFFAFPSILKITIHFVKGGGQGVIGISGSLIWSKTLMELMFNPCGEFW